MVIQHEHRFVIEASNRHDLESKLKMALDELIPLASALRDRGITVTRRSPRDYIVELDPNVEFGLTVERCEWNP